MNKVRRILITSMASLSIFGAVFYAIPVHAAEITPDSSSYSYGSTSEIAPSTTITTNGSSLASTGDPANIVKIVAIVLIVVGAGVGIRVLIRRKQKA